MEEPPRKRPLQFSLRAMLGLMVAVSVLFGPMRWIGVSATVSTALLVLVVVGMPTTRDCGGAGTQTIGILATLFRGIGVLAIGTAAACLYCVGYDPETGLFGFVVTPLLLPSIALYLCMQRQTWPGACARTGFFLPVLVMMGLFCYTLWSMPSGGRQDGADQILVFLMEAYGVGLCAALACLRWGRNWKCVGMAPS